MSKFEVFLPPAREGDVNLTLRVEADNWMAALKAGLKKLGEQGAQVSNLMVDIMEDNSIHVTDSSSGRVFRIKELEGAAESAAVEPAPATQPVTPTSAPAPAPAPFVRAPEATLPGSDAPTPRDTPVAQLPQAPPAKVAKAAAESARSSVKPSDKPAPAPQLAPQPKAPQKVPVEPPRAAVKPAAAVPAALLDTAEARRIEQVAHPSQPIEGPIGRAKSSVHVEEVLSELFERTQDAFSLERERGLAFLLDLALEKIPAESGSVFVADFATSHLALLDARGPKSLELKRMKLRLPVGVGIVGFCAQEAVSLAISDTEKDPRFYKDVSDKLGYATRSILCAPMVKGGRTFGCLEVINKKGSSHFTDSELAILAYVAHQGASYLDQKSGG